MEEISFAAFESTKDKRTIKHNSLIMAGAPLMKGGIDYLPGEVKHQHKVGICTGISKTQNRDKTNGKEYSADFQYLLQKKFYDGNWIEGSSLLSALKVGKKYGFLPIDLWTHTTEQDRFLPYSEYITKLQAIPDVEIYRLISLCVDRIPGYAQVDVNDLQSLARGIVDSSAGLLCMYWIGKEWWTAQDGRTSWNPSDISPIRPPVEVIGGHAIIMNKFNFNMYNVLSLANTWGTEWCNAGCADTIWDNYKPREAWIITKGSVIAPFTKDIYFAMSGPTVVNLQNALKIKGFFNHTSTGFFGPLTLLAVRAFQKTHGIIGTGYVGPLTKTCLNNLFKQ